MILKRDWDPLYDIYEPRTQEEIIREMGADWACSSCLQPCTPVPLDRDPVLRTTVNEIRQGIDQAIGSPCCQAALIDPEVARERIAYREAVAESAEREVVEGGNVREIEAFQREPPEPCPYCRRAYRDLAAHIERKHPDGQVVPRQAFQPNRDIRHPNSRRQKKENPE